VRTRINVLFSACLSDLSSKIDRFSAIYRLPVCNYGIPRKGLEGCGADPARSGAPESPVSGAFCAGNAPKLLKKRMGLLYCRLIWLCLYNGGQKIYNLGCQRD
jgi:hypothetical protein